MHILPQYPQHFVYTLFLSENDMYTDNALILQLIMNIQYNISNIIFNSFKNIPIP